MSPELDKQLCEKYPELFRGRNKPMTETLMCWGFECDDGWYDLIDGLCLALSSYCEDNNIEIPEAVQVKEKFGGLRFYLGGVHKDHFHAVHGLTDQAEKMSYKICEVCGKPGEPNIGGWIKTTCEKHKQHYD